MSSKIHPIMEYGLRMSEAIGCLRIAGHNQATIILLYSAIDTMAWLSIEEEEARNVGFKAWVETYMLKDNASLLAGATSTDLWGARCGVLHTSAPESRDFRNNRARKIHYVSNLGEVSSDKNDIIYISLESFGKAFAAALISFQDALQTNQIQDDIARSKIKRMFRDMPM